MTVTPRETIKLVIFEILNRCSYSGKCKKCEKVQKTRVFQTTFSKHQSSRETKIFRGSFMKKCIFQKHSRGSTENMRKNTYFCLESAVVRRGMFFQKRSFLNSHFTTALSLTYFHFFHTFLKNYIFFELFYGFAKPALSFISSKSLISGCFGPSFLDFVI